MITHEGLTEFVQAVRRTSASIQRLLDRTPRRDIEQKPAQQLGELLRLVGLSIKKTGRKRIGDQTIYQYQINEQALAAAQAIVANRRNHSGRRDLMVDDGDVPARSQDLQKAITQAAAEFKSKPKRPKAQKKMADVLLGDGSEPAKIQAG